MVSSTRSILYRFGPDGQAWEAAGLWGGWTSACLLLPCFSVPCFSRRLDSRLSSSTCFLIPCLNRRLDSRLFGIALRPACGRRVPRTIGALLAAWPPAYRRTASGRRGSHCIHTSQSLQALVRPRPPLTERAVHLSWRRQRLYLKALL
jgi:hypothetical protein